VQLNVIKLWKDTRSISRRICTSMYIFVSTSSMACSKVPSLLAFVRLHLLPRINHSISPNALALHSLSLYHIIKISSCRVHLLSPDALKVEMTIIIATKVEWVGVFIARTIYTDMNVCMSNKIPLRFGCNLMLRMNQYRQSVYITIYI